MKISLDGFLLRTADEMPRKKGMEAWALRELHSNLSELATRMDAGDGDAALREFFSIYVIRRQPAPTEP